MGNLAPGSKIIGQGDIETKNNKNKAGGYAGLNNDKKIDLEQLPDGIFADVGGRNYILNSKFRENPDDFLYIKEFSEDFNPVDGEEWTLSFELKVLSDIPQEVYYIIDFQKDEDVIPDSSFYADNTKYTKHSLTFISENADQYNRSLEFSNLVSVRNLKLERGNTPTDWLPAPEDLVEKSIIGKVGGIAKINEEGKVIDAAGNPVEGSVTSVNGQTGDVTGLATEEDVENLNVFVITEDFVATENQTLFTLTEGSYTVGMDRISLVVGGVPQTSPTSFAETSPTSFTLSEGVPGGTKVYASYYSALSPITTDLEGIVSGHTVEIEELKNRNIEVPLATDTVAGITKVATKLNHSPYVGYVPSFSVLMQFYEEIYNEVETLFTTKAKKVQEALITPTMASGWTLPQYYSLKFFKDEFGMVYVSGQVTKVVGAGVAILYLPVGYRPKDYLYVTAVDSTEKIHGAYVNPSGSLSITNYSAITNNAQLCFIFNFRP